MFKEENTFEKFESKVWLSSPTMHGPEIKYAKEAYETTIIMNRIGFMKKSQEIGSATKE